jgi:copper homeostasis protein
MGTMMRRLLEICVDNLEAAKAAALGGADRIEVCSMLEEGGLTPSVELLRSIKAEVAIPAFVMIRPRGGDFVYSRAELLQMSRSVEELHDAGADGFVFGILNRERLIDQGMNFALQRRCEGRPVTFHRAIDRVHAIVPAANLLSDIGFDRILTSGGAVSAMEGAENLRRMIEFTDGEIIIMPGGGIRPENLEEVLRLTGAVEFHSSARPAQDSLLSPWRVDVEQVRAMRKILDSHPA